jgi:gliding motility-associated-like protein
LRVQLNPLKSAHTDTTDTIRIHPKPNANFFVSDTSGVLTYNFLSGKIPDNNIKYKFYWKLNPPPTSLIDTTSKIDTIPNDGVHDLFTHVFSAEAYGANANLMKLKVIDDFGCVDSFEQKFDVKEKLYIPNVFTPNGDGVNDFFTIVTNGKTAYHFQIFTSSGQLVFEQTSRTLSWDGITSSGGKALTGTYFYILEPGPSNSKKPYSGFFMLLR